MASSRYACHVGEEPIDFSQGGITWNYTCELCMVRMQAAFRNPAEYGQLQWTEAGLEETRDEIDSALADIRSNGGSLPCH